MPNSRTTSAGLVVIAATAGTLFGASPASALSPLRTPGIPSASVPARAVHAAPALSRGDGDGDGDGGWWWWSSSENRPRRHHFCDGSCGHGFRRHFYGGYGGGGFGTSVDRTVTVVTNDVDIGVTNSNTNVVVAGGW